MRPRNGNGSGIIGRVTPSSNLVVIGEEIALMWILREERIALPKPRYASQQRHFVAGDQLFLYTTRGCFHNPTRDRSRVIGRAVLTSDMAEVERPIQLAGRDYPFEAALRIDILAPAGHGVEMAQLTSLLSCFPSGKSWAPFLRRSTVPLTMADTEVLLERLPSGGELEMSRTTYLQR